MTSAVLVVARYQEDISWLGQIDMPALVYDKSGRSCAHPLPNIGRETHTYLHHILRWYPDFPDYTFFLQGNPFPHLPAGMTPQGLEEQMRTVMLRKMGFKGLANYTIRCDAQGLPNNIGSLQTLWAGKSQDIPVGTVYKQLFCGPVPESFHCRAPAGLFGVHRERILCRTRMFYETAFDIVVNDPDDTRNTGHAFERLWYIVFNGYEKLNKQSFQ